MAMATGHSIPFQSFLLMRGFLGHLVFMPFSASDEFD